MKIKKIFFSTLISISLLLGSTFPCFADARQNNFAVFPSEDALSFLAENGSTVADRSIPLYSLENEVIAYYYEMNPAGYCIVDNFGNIIECYFNNEREIPAEKIFYLSPTVL